ncbi:MAG: protein kinase domain-containing protein [Cumulibacter sp.]
MSSTTPDQMVGVLLDGRYRVVRRLASGGMSVVYVGYDERLDRPVAIKIMNADLATDPPFLDRFTREARAAARILHPNIVTVHDQGTDDEHSAVYLVMELVSGGTLRDLMRERGTLSPGAALAVMEPLLRGLGAAHAEGLVHRDVKPENILIDRNGRVLVADFGLARAVAESSHTTHSGKTGAVFGTISYLSPEQVTTGRADARSDVYAAGIMLYEMLTGSPPYVGDNAVSVAYRHVNDDVPPPSESDSEIPGELDDLVIAATTRDPLKRPADARRMLEMTHAARESLALGAVAAPTLEPPEALKTSVAGGTGATDYVGATPARVNAPDTRDTRDQGDPQANQSEDDGAPPDGSDSGGGSTAQQPATIMTGSDRQPTGDELFDEDDDDRPRPRRQRRWVAPVIVLITVAALLAGAGFWWMQWGRWTTVPDFSTASSQQDLSDLAGEAGVDIRLGESEFSETVAEGSPISVDPAAGTKVTRGTDVDVVLSKGPERYVVSEALVGQESTTAMASITSLVGDRIEIEVIAEYDEDVAADAVVGFNPPAGTEMKPSSTLQVIISKGRTPVPLPDVHGASADEAMKTLTEAGFSPSVSDEKVFSDEEIDTVAETEPAAGTKAQPGADVQVTVVLSKGPDLVEVPKVIGSSTDTATATLQEAGFVVDISTVFTTLGLVAVQSPEAGTMAKRGSTVTIQVV